jgi:predicted esterase
MTTQTPAYPEPYTILPHPPQPHRNTLILLHGTSTSGPELAAPLLSTNFTFPSSLNPTTLPLFFSACKFVFPTGALNPTTVFNGKETNAWFNIHSFADRTIGEDTATFRRGLRASIRFLTNLIKVEVDILEKKNEDRGGSGKVVLGGFSQGSAMVIVLLLSGELERAGVGAGFGGVVGVSGWLPLRSQIEQAFEDQPHIHDPADLLKEKRAKARGFLRRYLELDEYDEGIDKVGNEKEWLDVPIFLGHGRLDEKVRFEWGLQMADALFGLGFKVQKKAYDGVAHWWCEEEIADIAEFMEKVWRGDVVGVAG